MMLHSSAFKILVTIISTIIIFHICIAVLLFSPRQEEVTGHFIEDPFSSRDLCFPVVAQPLGDLVDVVVWDELFVQTEQQASST
jgi:hypothetical protein